MIEVTAKDYNKTVAALAETMKFVEKNPSSSNADFYKKHAEKLCSLLENFKIVDTQPSSERLASANQVYEFMKN